MDQRQKAEEIFARYRRPVYRIEVLHRPKPDLPKGTSALLTFSISGEETVARMVYQGDGRWIPEDLHLWLNEAEDR